MASLPLYKYKNIFDFHDLIKNTMCVPSYSNLYVGWKTKPYKPTSSLDESIDITFSENGPVVFVSIENEQTNKTNKQTFICIPARMCDVIERTL